MPEYERVSNKMSSQSRPVKVLLAKLGLDGHDRGVKVIARALRDSGMEVVYMGMRGSLPTRLLEWLMQEDVQVIGISILSGAHLRLISKLAGALDQQEHKDVLLLVGGTIPDQDVQPLRDMGVDAVYPVGTFTSEIVDYIRSNAPAIGA